MLTIIVLVGRATTVLFTAVLAGLQRTITDSATATPDLRRPLTSQVTNQADLAWEQGVAGSNPAVPTSSTNPLLSRGADGPSLG
jgi:hypothetical protein